LTKSAASLLVRGATIFTQDAKRAALRDCDVLVEEGRIAKIGKGLREKAEFVVGGSGKLLLPGFINSHTHAAMSLLRGLEDESELQDAWLARIWREEARLKEKDVYHGTRLAALEMIKSGTTCFADFYFFPDAVAKAAAEIGIRARIGPDVQDRRTPQAKDGKEALRLSERFARRFSKGGLVSAVAYAHSVYTCSGETIVKAMEIGKKHGLKTHIHVSETRKEAYDLKKKTGKRPVEWLDSLGVLSPEMAAGHCVWLTKSEVSLLGKRGASVAHCPVSNMKLAGGGAAPVPEMLGSGVNVALGTDGPASNNSLDMIDTMKMCALLHKNARWDARAVSAQQVLDFATRNGAAGLGVDAGSIGVGKLADFILLDLKAPNLSPAGLGGHASQVVYAANAGNVSDVVIDGKLLLNERRFVGLDEEKIIAEAARAAESIR